MANKKIKNWQRKVPKKKKKRDIFVGRDPAMEMEAFIRSVVINMVSGLEIKLDDLIDSVGNIKANLIATTSCLEDAGIIKEKDFMEKYDRYVIEELGAVEGGQMVGTAIFSLYNVDEFKESS